jgi:hypothetical protein
MYVASYQFGEVWVKKFESESLGQACIFVLIKLHPKHAYKTIVYFVTNLSASALRLVYGKVLESKNSYSVALAKI